MTSPASTHTRASHGAAHAAPAPHAKHVETSHAGTKFAAPAPSPVPASAPLPPDPLDALKTGLSDLKGELDALTKLPDTFSQEARERIGKIQSRVAELNTAVNDHVENLGRNA